MQMSVDSLASLFPTLMSSSSMSFHDDKTSGSGVFSDSVVDSGIVLSNSPIVDIEVDSAVPNRQVQHKELSTQAAKSVRSSDSGTPINQYKTSPASAGRLTEYLNALQTALNCANASDYEFDADVFPFSSETHEKPAVAKQTEHNQKRANLSRAPPSHVTAPPRDVDEISSSLAASVERLRRGRIAVDGAFGRALAEDRRRQRELARLRRRMLEAQRDILLGTLRDLRRELDDQCCRLQVAYDAVLAARWPRLHADTAHVMTPSAHPPLALPSMGQSAI